MKLVRYGEKGREKPGVIDENDILRDAAAMADDWRGAFLSDNFLSQVRAADLPPADISGGFPRLGVPVATIGKIIGIGLNYRAHAAEAGMSPPEDPIIFLKSPDAANGPHDDIALPRGSTKTDWEIELAVVFGKDGKYISEKNAFSHVAGYCIANDVSEREYQLQRGPQWTKGKSADTFAPLGPWIATRDEIPAPQNLNMSLSLNGEMRQRGNTGDMVFPLAELIARVSAYMTIRAGDVMITGTPPGVGLGATPPRFLRPGDELHLRIDGLGEQRAKVRASD